MHGYYLSLIAVAANHGTSPATNVIFRAEIGLVGTERSDGQLMNAFGDKYRNIPDQTAEAIFPGDSKNVGFELFLPQEEIDKAASGRTIKVISAVVYGCIQYKAKQPEGMRQTRFAYRLGYIKEGQPIALIYDGPDWFKQNVVLFEPGLSSAD